MYLPRASLLVAQQQEKALSEILGEYVEYIDFFSADLIMKLSDNTGINRYAIELVEGKEHSYKPIYNISQVKRKISKMFIETQPKVR